MEWLPPATLAVSRERIEGSVAGPSALGDFAEALRGVPAIDRDAWVNERLGLEPPPDDGPELPGGCVPYLPCPAGSLLRLVETAAIDRSDLFVDIGAGVGRASVIVHLLTGARALGVEVQSQLVRMAQALTGRLQLGDVRFLEADAATLPEAALAGTVFFLYCPFSGARLQKVLDQLRAVAQRRPIRVACVDLPLPSCPWLEAIGAHTPELTVYRSRSS